MATATKRNLGGDRRRTGTGMGRNKATRMRKAKKSLGRKTRRKAVMRRARSGR